MSIQSEGVCIFNETQRGVDEEEGEGKERDRRRERRKSILEKWGQVGKIRDWMRGGTGEGRGLREEGRKGGGEKVGNGQSLLDDSCAKFGVNPEQCSPCRFALY